MYIYIHIKDTIDLLSKLASLPPMSDDVILCTIDVAGLYPNIPHDEGFIKEFLLIVLLN